jgi:hypothetical protein
MAQLQGKRMIVIRREAPLPIEYRAAHDEAAAFRLARRS